MGNPYLSRAPRNAMFYTLGEINYEIVFCKISGINGQVEK
jgi:hypothetical protein